MFFNRPGQEIDIALEEQAGDRKSTRLNSSHLCISYAVFCLKKKMVKSNMIRDFDAFSRASLDAALSMEPGGTLDFRNPEGSAIEAICEGTAVGRLAGGNLALLTSLLGTPYAPDTRGTILPRRFPSGRSTHSG